MSWLDAYKGESLTNLNKGDLLLLSSFKSIEDFTKYLLDMNDKQITSLLLTKEKVTFKDVLSLLKEI